MPALPSRWVITPANNTDDADVFPTLAGANFKIEKTPTWATKTDISVSGVERRRQLWSYPVWKFQLGYGFLRDASANQELQRLTTFFNMKNGSTQGFFYNDADDNAVTAMNFGTGDGATTVFQMSRTTTIGGITFTDPVRGFNGAPSIYVGGVLQTVTTNYSIGSLGQITFVSAPANGAALTWTGNFLFLCRFEKDDLGGLGQIYSGVWDLKALTFVTFKA